MAPRRLHVFDSPDFPQVAQAVMAQFIARVDSILLAHLDQIYLLPSGKSIFILEKENHHDHAV